MNELIPPAQPTASLALRLQWERRARALLEEVAAQAGAEPSEAGVLSTVLAAVCGHTGWPLAHCYRLEADGRLHSSHQWQGAEDPRFADFVALTHQIPFAAGEGLPGRVLASGRPAWISDVAGDVNFPRAAPYLAAGLGAAFAFPVLRGAEITAVLEFFSDHPQPPDEALLDVLQSIGQLVGHLTSRRRAEAALAASEARFRAISDSAPDAIVAVDTLGHVTFWSPAATRMFGHAAEAMLGRTLDAIIPPELRDAHQAGITRVRDTGQSRLTGRTVEVTALRADGSRFPAELTLGQGHHREGRLFTAVIRDITERHADRQRLSEQAEALRQQHEALQRSHSELIAAQRLMERIFTAYAEILPGTVLNERYRLEEAVGSGGYGVVYRGVQVALGRPVAVKLFRPASGRVSPDQLLRFQREGRAMCRINHKNAVTVIDAGVSADGLPYLVMELLQGETLAARLSQARWLTPRHALRLGADLCSALHAMHQVGLVHRDIKPENVFLHREGEQEIPKLLDFGIARLVEDEDARLTETGRVIGTPAYIAPERMDGEPGDHRSDVFSLGVLLYRAIAGSGPFPSASRGRWPVVYAHASPPALSLLGPGVPAELDEWVGRALSPDPSQRPSAEALAAALARLAPLASPQPVLTRLPAPTPADETVALDTPSTDLQPDQTQEG